MNQRQLSKELLILAYGDRFHLSLSFGLTFSVLHRCTQRNSLCKYMPPGFLNLVMHCCSLQLKISEQFFRLLGKFLHLHQVLRERFKNRAHQFLHLTYSRWNPYACTKVIQTYRYTHTNAEMQWFPRYMDL